MPDRNLDIVMGFAQIAIFIAAGVALFVAVVHMAVT